MSCPAITMGSLLAKATRRPRTNGRQGGNQAGAPYDGRDDQITLGMGRDFGDAVWAVKDLNRGIIHAGAQSFRGVRIGKRHTFWTKQSNLLCKSFVTLTGSESYNRKLIWKPGDNVKRIVAYGVRLSREARSVSSTVVHLRKK